MESLARGIVKRVITGDAKGEFEVVNHGCDVVLEAEGIFWFPGEGGGRGWLRADAGLGMGRELKKTGFRWLFATHDAEVSKQVGGELVTLVDRR